MIQDERGHYTWVDDDLARRAALPSSNHWREWGERWRRRCWFWRGAAVVSLIVNAWLWWRA